MMTRQESARINGALSHGPVTAQGKARSSQNATRHGLNAKAVVLAHESQEEFDRLLADFESRFLPVGDVERDLVLALAAARWRLRRLQAMEKAVFEQEIQRILKDEENPVDRETAISIAYANLAAGPALNRLHKYEARLQRDYVTSERLLLVLQEARRETAQNAQIQNEPDLDGLIRQMHAETAEMSRDSHESELEASLVDENTERSPERSHNFTRTLGSSSVDRP